jgi:hypothetical protein
MNNHAIACRTLVNTLTLLALFAVMKANAGEVNTGYFGSVAIKGYDPVAYFTMKRPIKGSEEFELEWLAATWRFSNEEHRTLFAGNPVKYAPQYGGFCADGIAYGDTTTNIDPAAWRIIDGKLYLNYDQGAAAELEELPGQLDKAAANWPKVRSGLLEASE